MYQWHIYLPVVLSYQYTGFWIMWISRHHFVEWIIVIEIMLSFWPDFFWVGGNLFGVIWVRVIQVSGIQLNLNFRFFNRSFSTSKIFSRPDFWKCCHAQVFNLLLHHYTTSCSCWINLTSNWGSQKGWRSLDW